MEDPDQAFGGGSQIRGSQKVFTCLITPAFLWQSLLSPKVVTFCRPRKWLFLLVKLCGLSGTQHNLKSPCVAKKFDAIQKDRSHFSQAGLVNAWQFYRDPGVLSQQCFHGKNRPMTCPESERYHHQYTLCIFTARHRFVAGSWGPLT